MEVENNITISTYYKYVQPKPKHAQAKLKLIYIYSTDTCDCRAWLSVENNFAAQK